MNAMLLAAGLGTRLRPLTEKLPKPSIPVCNRPLINYLLERLINEGFDRIVINFFHLGEELKKSIERPFFKKAEIIFSEEATLLGTGGGIKNAEKFLSGSDFLVLNGDVYFDAGFREVLDIHTKNRALCTMVLRKDPLLEQYGGIGTDASGVVRRFLNWGVASPSLNYYMFSGVHAFSPELFDYLPEGIPSCIKEEFYKKAVLSASGSRVFSLVRNSLWLDFGNLELFYNNNFILKKHLNLKGDSDGNLLGQHLQIGQNCRIKNSIIGDSSIIGDECGVENSILLPGAKIDDGSLVINSVISGEKTVFSCKVG